MTTVCCKKCQEEKELNPVNFKPEKKTKLGFDTTCRECRGKKQAEIRKSNPERFKEKDQKVRESDKYKQYQEKYREENAESLKEFGKARYKENKEPYLKRSREQQARMGDSYKKYQKEYGKKNRKKLSAKYLHKLKTDPKAKLKHTLRGQFRKLIKGIHKTNSVLNYLGCDVDFLKDWLASQFIEGMTWENHGSVWHVDHIIPCAVFDFSQEKDLQKCWHYTNLRPLFAAENLSKHDRLGEARGREFTCYEEYLKTTKP